MSPEQNPFFGRRPILERILPSLVACAPASFVVAGARLTGKSALLRQIETLALALPPNEHTKRSPRPLRLDCARIHPPQALWSAMLTALAPSGSDGEPTPAPPLAADEDDHATARQHFHQQVTALFTQNQRPILLLDNFDQLLLPSAQPAAFCAELQTLTAVVTLVLTTQKPLYDVDAALAGSPLVSTSTQFFLGLLERDAALQWLAYHQHSGGLGGSLGDDLAADLLPSTGRHPYLLHKVGDCLAEVQPLGLPGQAESGQLLPLLRLRIAEHGRPLFLAQWRLLHDPPASVAPGALNSLVERLLRSPLPADLVRGEWLPTLNWLINQALIAYSASEDRLAYTWYSPLFSEFLAHTPPASPAEVNASSAAPPVAPAVYEALTKIEASLLRYLQEHSQRVVSSEQLLADVWKRPGVSSRRVEEAVRRLRLQLDQQSPPVGEIKNERGRGYRFVPAQPTMRLSL